MQDPTITSLLAAQGRVAVSCGTNRLKTGTTLLALAVLLSVTVAHASEKISLDGPWTRIVEGEDPIEFGVPASFDPIDGVATYVRKFTVEAEFLDGIATLHFDGVVGQATVFLNDSLLGAHGSFTPFWFDVSDVLRPVGQENVLVVVIDDHRDSTTIPAQELAWLHYSGIHRNVYIKFSYKAAILRSRIQYDFGDATYNTVTGEVYVDVIGKPGTEVTLLGALLEGPAADELQIVGQVSSSEAVLVDASGLARTTLWFSLANPRLWSPQDPNLYSLWVAAVVDGLGADETLDRVGFRDIAVEGADILLNGKPIFLKGVTRHDIYDGTGFNGTDQQMEDDMVRLKQMGATYVRLIHYPHHTRILELADELGLMVSCEIPAWAEFSDEGVRQKLYEMYKELIQRDMNHPAVIMWISGNARGRPMPYAAEAQQLAKWLDRNRLASYVIDSDLYDPDSIAADLRFVQDAGLDVYAKVTLWYWYIEYRQEAWASFPTDVPILIAELGFEGNDREPVTVFPGGGDTFDSTEQLQASAISRALEAWRPHLPFYSEHHISGLSIFSWQDIDWPDVSLFFQNHIPTLHYGLVYADREDKQALETVSTFYTTLPTESVGPLHAADTDIEERFSEATNLPFPVNTSSRDLGASFSGSGGAIYFASDAPDSDGIELKLTVVESEGGQWQERRLLEIPEEQELYAFHRSPCLSFDGRTLYYTRPYLSGVFAVQTRTRIWTSEFVGGRWHAPSDMGDVINTSDSLVVTSDPSLTIDENTLYFSSNRPDGFGGTDLWVSRRVDGEWQFPQNLGGMVNSVHDDGEPSISADGSTLYFSSDRPGGFGSSDLWVSHSISGEWTEPKNLGPELNTTGAEREPEISKDGDYLLFTGIRDGGHGLSDIWYARVPGAPDLSDLSSALTVEVKSNNPGTIVIVTPSDVDGQGDGAVDPIFVRRYRRATPVTLAVPSTYNGFAFWRWEIGEQPATHSETSYSFDVTEDTVVEVKYAIPVSVSILGADQLPFDGQHPSAATVEYEALAAFIDGSTQTVRSGLAWSVDDEQVATVDPVTGILTPRPMEGEAVVTLFVQAEVGGFELPIASKVVHLYGKVATEPSGGGSLVGSGRPTPCGAIGSVFVMFAVMARFGLSFLIRRRRFLRPPEPLAISPDPYPQLPSSRRD